MLVSDIMTINPVTVRTGTPLTDTQVLMRQEKVHRLPVVDAQGRLCGIVSEKDLLNVAPSQASTLDMYEMVSLLSKIKVDDVMTRKVITVGSDSLVEDAARLLADNDIGGVPVVNDQQAVVGIVTESDLFHLFIEMFGSRKKGLRICFLVPEQRGELAEIAGAIAAQGGNILAVGTAPGTDSSNVRCIMKLEGMAQDLVLKLLAPLVLSVLDVRQV